MQQLISIDSSDFPEISSLDLIGDNDLQIPSGCWIAGGYVRDTLRGVEWSDIDIYSESAAARENFIVENKLKITFSAPRLHQGYLYNKKIQIIRVNYKNIEECLNSFDYTICQFAYDGKQVYTTKSSLIDLVKGRIRVNKIQPGFELDSMRRLLKYHSKGFKICGNTLKDVAESFRRDGINLDSQVEFYPNGRATTNRWD